MNERDTNDQVSQEHLVLTAVEYIARGLKIPQYVRDGLDTSTLQDLEGLSSAYTDPP